MQTLACRKKEGRCCPHKGGVVLAPSQFFKGIWPDPLPVETTDGFAFVSHANFSCTCGEFAKHKLCSHVGAIQRWLGPRFDRWLCYSAIHKEIRRSDPGNAGAWAQILLHHQSEKSLLKYLERIVFEESRAATLWLKLRQRELSARQALEWMALTRKKWELSYLNQPSHCGAWFAGFQRAFSRPPLVPLELSHLLRRAQDPADIYAIFFDLRRAPDLQPYFWNYLAEIAAQTKNDRLSVFLKHEPSSSYERMFAGELLLNMYASEAKDRHSSSSSKSTFIPMTRKYHHDLHTGHGKSIWVNCFAEAWQAKSFQFGELDARFSGSVISNLWRERCFHQYGSMKQKDGRDWHWSDVTIQDIDYLNAMAVESHYYQAVIKKIEMRHPNLIPNSGTSLSK